jgi:hypothetical protein
VQLITAPVAANRRFYCRIRGYSWIGIGKLERLAFDDGGDADGTIEWLIPANSGSSGLQIGLQKVAVVEGLALAAYGK